MPHRDGLIAARGQILWIALLVAGSVAILRSELPPPSPAPVAAADGDG